ncbi:AtpZ/AtpI family protein [Phycisphaerales bacterium AB-hyl4]|uniref:AtpZ/AtpI family protein n=1 Tax=Natronomicrosphaera hydrolytica TaxID=3242702 RepID=A0ABV4U5W7_9BACT
MPRSEQPNQWQMAHIGLELAGAVVVLALAGYWVDRQFATGPWGVLAGTAIGFVGGMYLFIKQALKANKQFDTRRSGDKNNDTHK